MNVAGYNDMAPVIPEGVCGDYRITHREKKWPSVIRDAFDSYVDWTLRFAREGTYCILWNTRTEETLMSDTDFERVTNEDVLSDAYGDVLIVGLGIGMLPHHLCKLEKVRSVTILELQPEVVALVYPYIKHPKLQVVLADGTEERLPFREHCYRPRYFDYAYLDIWSSAGIPWTELSSLINVYSNRYAQKVDGWLREHIEIVDTLGIGSLPNMSRPASGWRYHQDDGANNFSTNAAAHAILGKGG